MPPTPSKATPAPSGRSWALVRAGGNLIGARWRAGVLEIRKETLFWTDAKDPSRNLLVPLARLASHALLCRTGTTGEVCDTWSFRTAEGETERFRDPEASRDTCASPAEIFRHVMTTAPSVAVSVAPAKAPR